MILLPKKSWSGKPFTLPGARSVFYDLVVFGIQTMYRKNKNINPNASRSAMFLYWLARSNRLQTGCSLRGHRFFWNFYFSET
uniref:Uncharacterized protein n=1 Tax=Candidatus Kentrum sp. SD TaxID=2126332 RepID=A0A450Y5I7_9GAMM|nr:MAG: hypothetical protein BECKSD772F_GA0070984_100539 [Candidatus Kentron sp. SD]VFK40416.1 MAG: hypothetical protein BECKSD772E_GA0070983_100639 [Candidatus Kentron sp. SD]